MTLGLLIKVFMTLSILFKGTYLLTFSSPFVLSKNIIQVSNSSIDQWWTRSSIIHVSKFDLETQAGYIIRKIGPSRNLRPHKTQHINREKVRTYAYLKGVPEHDFRVRPAEGTKRLIPEPKPHFRNKTKAKKDIYFVTAYKLGQKCFWFRKNISLVSGSLYSNFIK